LISTISPGFKLPYLECDARIFSSIVIAMVKLLVHMAK
jgi:hypothetical protein